MAIGELPELLDPGFLSPRTEWGRGLGQLVRPVRAGESRHRAASPLPRHAGLAPPRHSGQSRENTFVFNLLNGIQRTANQDAKWAGRYTPEFIQALSDFALVLPDTEDIRFAINNGIYALGNLRLGEPVSAVGGRAHQILSQVLQVRAVDSEPYLTALSALEDPPYNSRLADGTRFDVAGYRRELASRVFSNTYSYDNGTMVFRTPLDAEKVARLYDALREVKAQFYRVTQALRPRDGDTNAVLTLRIYGTRADYEHYQLFLYGLGTDTITGGRASGSIANGAGVRISDVTGRAIVRRYVIQGNRAEGDGGGVSVRNSAALIEHCDILDNEARNGGVLIEHSRIVANTATEVGGGFVGNGGRMRGVLVALNEALHSLGGGGSYAGRNPVQLEHCVIHRNRAGSYFAGLGAVYGGTLRVRNSIFAGHDDGPALGLGWGNDPGRLDARHCLFFDNRRHFAQRGQGDPFAVDASALNALTNFFQHALTADPLWAPPPRPAGVVTNATYDAASRRTVLALAGANLAPRSLRGILLANNANDSAAVFENTTNDITVLGRHDSLANWSQWHPLDFRLAAGSPAIDAGRSATSTRDPDGFPRGVDLSSFLNGAGDGSDLGLYEYRGEFAREPLLHVESDRAVVTLRWPQSMAGWRVDSSPDLRRWTPVAGEPVAANGWQRLQIPIRRAQEFYRLAAP